MYRWRFTVRVWLMVAAGTWLSCSDPKPSQQTFYYYPDLNLYFDVARQHYLYSMDGGTTWDSIGAKTKTIPTALGPQVVLYATSDSIWKDNAAHRRQYNGYVYNVTDDDQPNDDTATMVTEKKKPPKKVVTTPGPETEKKEKEKKGLGKLLQKIFGKNKDKKEGNN